MLDLAAAEERHAELRARFGERVGLVHGRLAGKDKDRVMAAFASGALSILVSTTVIEVGVDVPNASIMIIEHAERFGLAQLHQLRGRVGRGAEESSCILLYRQPLSEAARERLNVMRSTEDGFVIAEEDLRLRGGGEVLGTRQSGLPAVPHRQPARARGAAPGRARRGAADARARPGAQRRRCRDAEAAALSVRARRRDQADARGLAG